MTNTGSFSSLCSVLLLMLALPTSSSAVPLGSATTFAVLGGSGVTAADNGTPTTIVGDLGVSPGVSVTGFPPATVTGSIHVNDSVAIAAHSDLITAFNDAGSRAPTTDLSGQNLGTLGGALTPGVYFFSSSALLDGVLNLSGSGEYIFQITTALTTGTGSVVNLLGGAEGNQVFWQIGSSATLGSSSVFQGSILADQSISLDPDAVIQSGRALAIDGAVTLAGRNSISAPNPLVAAFDVPELSPAALGAPLALLALWLTLVGDRRKVSLKF